jgi:alanyl-tRNA synthetase
VSDGIVRLYYVAGERVISRLNEEDRILNYLSSSWGIAQHDIVPTADRFFNGYKKYEIKCKSQEQRILDLQM